LVSLIERFKQQFGKDITEFETFKKATRNKKPQTVQNYRYNLTEFCLFVTENPDQIITNREQHLNSSDKREYYEEKALDFKHYLETTKKYAGRGVNGYLNRVRGFFSNNGSRYSLDFGSKALTYDQKRRVRKYSPSRSDCQAIYQKCPTVRDKLLFCLAFQNGLAPTDIANLDYKILPQEPFKFYESSRQKTGSMWFSAVTPEIVENLQEYLKIRGSPKHGDALFTGREGELDAIRISKRLKELIKLAGFGDIEGFKPTALRDAFVDCLIDAEIDSKFRESFMGHTSDIEHHYGSHKRLEANIENAMRKAYPKLSLSDKTVTYSTSKEQFDEIKQRLEESEKRHKETEQKTNAVLFKVLQTMKEIGADVDEIAKEIEKDGTTT